MGLKEKLQGTPNVLKYCMFWNPLRMVFGGVNFWLNYDNLLT